MEKADLTTDELFFLNLCNDEPNFQYIGVFRTTLNTLCSYGLAESIGNLKYNITKKGINILGLLQTQQGEEELEMADFNLVGKPIEAATFIGV